MSLRVPFPRLLPLTTVGLAGLLAVKSADLVRAAMPGKDEHGAAQTGATAPAPAASPSRPQASAAPPAATPHAPAPAAPHAAKAVAGSGDAKGAGTRAGAETPPSAAAAAAPEPAPVSDPERAVLLELRQRRQELDARDAALASREAVLGAAEQRIGARVEELKALQARLEGLEAARRARDESNWRGMVKLYENMKPRDAAVIFNDLDMPVLLQVIDRMKEAKAAAVMAAMQPDKARQVTTELAQMRSRANADPGPAGG